MILCPPHRIRLSTRPPHFGIRGIITQQVPPTSIAIASLQTSCAKWRQRTLQQAKAVEGQALSTNLTPTKKRKLSKRT